MEVSETGGVKPMSIEGRMGIQRERMLGMTDAERAYRARYLKSLILDKSEPVVPENYYKELHNPIRRFYRAPMEAVEKAMIPVVGELSAKVMRRIAAKLVMGTFMFYYGFYYFKYNHPQWTHRSGMRVFQTRKAMYPGDPDWPNAKDRTKGHEFYTLSFENSPL